MLNRNKLVPYLDKYREYLRGKGENETSNFIRNTDEDYKRRIATTARDALNTKEWKADSIGNGEISKCTSRAVQSHVNLIGRFQISSFRESLEKKTQAAEEVLFDLFHENKDQECFDKLCVIFGKKYDLISYLYFIHDPTKYLPLRPDIFDRIFKIIGTDFRTSHRCSWNNYQNYLKTIEEVRNIMQEYYQEESIDLLDAHSFLWDLKERVGQPPIDLDKVVFHRLYGDGTTLKETDERIYVDFNGKIRIFTVPDAFEKGYLEKPG